MKSGFITFLTYAAIACTGAAQALEADGGDSAPAGTGEPAKRRGRPPGGGAAPTPEPEKPKAKTGPTLEEIYAVVHPYIKRGAECGAAMKKLIATHGGSVVSEIPEENRAAFLADAEALAI